MLGVTVFGLFLTPVFFYVIASVTPAPSKIPRAADAQAAPGA
jgi:hypothetical protein